MPTVKVVWISRDGPHYGKRLTEKVQIYMKNENIQICYQVCSTEELCQSDLELVQMARQATFTSYSPYSNFSVGAAVRLSNGEIIKGSNQENAAFGAGTCAERCAIFYAQAKFPDENIVVIAIAARGTNGEFTKDPISPCGICRQVLVEARKRAGKPVKVILYGADAVLIIEDVSNLMPFQFDAIV